ncbi:MAG: DUF1007 family protein [Spirochaetaceae bacterium]
MKLHRLTPFIILLLLFPGATRLVAHPHVFIDSRVGLHMNGSELSYIRAHWTFDRFFTRMVMIDFRLDQSGTFTSEQIREVEEGAFRNLEHYDYYTYISIDGRDVDIGEVENFHASLNSDGRLVYEFDIPVGTDLARGSRNVEISMYDESFFTDMIFADDYLTVDGPPRVRYSSELTHDVHETASWGPMLRESVIVRFQDVE